VLAAITWRPGIGDHNPLSWCITVAYFVACWLCLSAGRCNSATAHHGGSQAWRLWFVFAGMMFLLGINKQLDLQSLLTQVGREIARHDGWYQRRRSVQAAFIGVCSIFGLLSSAAGLVLLRRHWQQFGVAYLGVVCLITFVVIRAASLHHVDTLLFGLPLLGNWMNFGLELGGTLLVVLGALLAPGPMSSGEAPPLERQGSTCTS